MTRKNTLFVCSRNQWRSPTAERIFRDDARLAVRSCGLSDKSPRRISQNDIRWAELIFVMEPRHQERIMARFRETVDTTPIRVLGIPDDYQFMDPELIDLLVESVEWHLTQIA